MNSPRVLRASLTVSLLLHAALCGLLVWWAGGSLAPAGRPLRVRILPPQESPAPPAAAPAPPRARPAPRPAPPRMPQGRGVEEPRETAPRPPAPEAAPPPAAVLAAPPRLEDGAGRRDPGPVESGLDASILPPRPLADAGEAPARRPPAPEAAPVPVAPALPPPRAVEKPLPSEALPAVRPPVAPRVEAMLPATPEPPPGARAPLPEAGLSLGGPVERRADLTPEPEARRREGPRNGGGAGVPALRRSLRDQIASLGSGMTAETGKQTINLDSREPRFLTYLARVKRRIERTWTYPPDALALGLGGDLVLVFTLNRAGTLTDVDLLRSSGFPLLDAEALRAVKAAAPFDPFPPELGAEPWNISASFHYNLPRASRPR